MVNSDLEQEYTIDDIEKVYENLKWRSEKLSIAITLLEGIGALDGLRLWIEFGYIIDIKKDVTAALGFNNHYIVAFDIGSDEPKSISIGCRDSDPVTVEIDGIVKDKAVEYTFRLLFNDYELYKLVTDNDNLEVSLRKLGNEVIKECSIVRESLVC